MKDELFEIHHADCFQVPASLPDNHPTQKPELLIRWLIRSYTHPDARVLDPFMGSGSTGVAALLDGPKFVGMEMDPAYYQPAETRLKAIGNE